MDSKPSEKRFALIIDADNVSSKYIKPITDELSKYGTITYKRIYGDWTSTLHAKWKDALLENSITPIQQFSYTTGKNATDSAMIIDAMDIMYTNSVEGFCIVSSDSDFTRLASRIRESGLTVIGMGEKKTPTPFRKACDIFTTLELLVGEGGKQSGKRGHRGQGGQAAGQGSGPSVEQVERAVVDIVTDNQNNGKSTGLGEVGSRLLKRYPDFDVRSYGTNQLTKLLGEFASVQVIKDGSSVMVELTEGGQAAPEPGEQPERDETVPAQPQAGAAHVDEADGSAAPEDAEGEGAKQEGDKPKRSRRSRSRRGRSKAAALEVAERSREQQGASEGQEPESAPAPAGEPDAAAASDAAAQAEDAPADRGDAGKAAAPDAQQAAPADEPAAGPEASGKADGGQPDAAPAPAPRASKPAARRGKRGTAAAKRPRKPADEAPAASEAGDRPKQTPESLIFDILRHAGSQGVGVAELNKRVRASFKSFKVRDLGFSQMRQYVASLPDIEVEKRGRDYFAKLAE